MKILKLSLSLLILLNTVSCVIQTNNAQVGTGIGAGAGAIIGQAIGRNKEATWIGVAVGGMLGYIIGNEMDKADKAQLSKVLEETPTGQTKAWVNPDTNNKYSVTPTNTYSTASNRDCRSAEIDAVIDGKPEKTYTKACRNQAGQWIIQS